MLARRSLLLSGVRQGTRRGLVGAAASASALVAPSSSNISALTTTRRGYMGQVFASNLAAHCAELGACTSLSTVLYSPLGSAMLIVLAYNVVVICTKHVNYSLEITAKDYVQDQQLYVIMRYGILSCILLGMEVMFIEV